MLFIVSHIGTQSIKLGFAVTGGVATSMYNLAGGDAVVYSSDLYGTDFTLYPSESLHCTRDQSGFCCIVESAATTASLWA